MPLEQTLIPCLSDNYAYVLRDPASGATALVDAPEAGPILDWLDMVGGRLDEIWLTHHHNDHIAGVEAIRAATGALVTGAAADAHRLPALDRAVTPDERFAFAAEQVHVLDAPGHTLGHIAFHLPKSALAFTGDSLMSAGCGRLFEGTPAQMWETLSRLSALPPETLICSGHEYTASNIRFALTLEPDNPALILRTKRVADLRAAGQPTLPVPLAEELATNPFLRVRSPEIRAKLGLGTEPDARVFAEIRSRKDSF